MAAQKKTPVATRDKAYSSQLSGTVVDTSGAVIAGATVQVRSADGSVQSSTRSDRDGSFIMSGLPAGSYRLVVSNPGFETKETTVTVRISETPVPLRISLVVGAVSTT
ncbi:MAG: carboxypeptidase-like regulatory domain-containing protein, partial [Terracidiphilus sp.]